MRTLIAMAVSAAILLSAPLAMAQGNQARQEIYNTWKKEQAVQAKIDHQLNNLLQQVDQVGSPSSGR